MNAADYVVGAGGGQLGSLEAGLVGSLTTPAISALSGGLLTIAAAIALGAALPGFRRYRAPGPAAEPAVAPAMAADQAVAPALAADQAVAPALAAATPPSPSASPDLPAPSQAPDDNSKKNPAREPALQAETPESR